MKRTVAIVIAGLALAGCGGTSPEDAYKAEKGYAPVSCEKAGVMELAGSQADYWLCRSDTPLLDACLAKTDSGDYIDVTDRVDCSR